MRSCNWHLLAALWVASISAVTAHAEDGYPPLLSGFLKPGMHVGLRSGQSESAIQVYLLSEEQAKIADDALQMNFQEISDKYPTVAKDELRSYASRPMIPHMIVHVGEDYVLLTHGQESKKMRAVATRFISSIARIEDRQQTAKKQNEAVNPSGGSGGS